MTYESTMPGEFGLGAHVFTLDGDDLGKVKEVYGEFFKVDASMQPDYWLRTSCIRTASSGRVDLSFDKDHLGDFKVSDPEEH